MSISPGSRLGPYELIEPLGSGGMGEVYKARDTRLDRTVAIKMLPPRLASEPEFQERFEREARVISSLDHPHICTLYDVGRENGTAFLVMQYLEGLTLAERLKSGPLSVDDALRMAVQIGEALDCAHRRGIVHRDLKPANVFLVATGAVTPGSGVRATARGATADAKLSARLLDFGLAKPAPMGDASVAESTQGVTLTARGTIVGTFQYMAPEQIEGHETDARSDIFAFGALLYEMLTGRHAFEGSTAASVIGAILRDHPDPVSRVRPLVPADLDYVVTRCLAKDPDDRWQTVRDLVAELKRVAARLSSTPRPGDAAAPVGGRAQRPWLPWAIATGALLAAAAAIAWAIVNRPAEPNRSVRRLVLPLGQLVLDPGVAISPDGSRIAFIARVGQRRQIMVRALAGAEATAVPGAETIGSQPPVFSPDGRHLLFLTGARLVKIGVDGNGRTVLASSIGTTPPHWGDDHTIVFGSSDGTVLQISASGGTPKRVSTKTTANEHHASPHLLPGGHALLYTVRDDSAEQDPPMIVAQSLRSGERRPLLRGGSPRYLPTGHLVFSRPGALFAVRFDAQRLALVGEPVQVLQGVRAPSSSWSTVYGVANDGTLVYLPGDDAAGGYRLAVVDASGRSEPLPFDAHMYSDPRVSPDGGRIVVHIFENRRDNWVGDLMRGTLTRLTYDTEEDETPTWSPDGRLIAYASNRGGKRVVFRKAADGTGSEERLWTGDDHLHVDGWSPDGASLVLSGHYRSSSDIALLTLADGRLKPLLNSEFNEMHPKLSPDGRWLAFTSDESGQPQVYVQPFPSFAGRWQISSKDGAQPVWSRDGRRLFFRGSGQMMVVECSTTPTFRASQPRPLFADRYPEAQGPAHTQFDVMPDGRLLLPERTNAKTAGDLAVVTDWTSEVERLVPVPR